MGTEPPERPREDRYRILVLLAVLTVAPLVVVAALWAAAAIGTWWALCLAIAVHLLTTVVVFAVVWYVMSGRPPLPRGRFHPA
jgi:polyferredoxin